MREPKVMGDRWRAEHGVAAPGWPSWVQLAEISLNERAIAHIYPGSEEVDSFVSRAIAAIAHQPTGDLSTRELAGKASFDGWHTAVHDQLREPMKLGLEHEELARRTPPPMAAPGLLARLHERLETLVDRYEAMGIPFLPLVYRRAERGKFPDESVVKHAREYLIQKHGPKMVVERRTEDLDLEGW